jgi:uridine kinase
MAGAGRVVYSVSTWRQPPPPAAGAERAAVLDELTGRVQGAGPGRVLVGIDGRTAAGKTTLGHEIAERLAGAGRVVVRASLDDFKRPWRESHLYDRVSGEGYYRNAFDRDAIRRLLFEPAGPGGNGRVAPCSIDPLTQRDHADQVVDMPADGVLVVDGVFAFRPELAGYWDLRVWVDVAAGASLRRGVLRDADRLGAEEAEALHRHRYRAAEEVYLREVRPATLAHVVVDNTDLERPRLTP